MQIPRILPGAAGVIALTATIGFIDGHREIEAESLARDKITLVSARTLLATAGATPGKLLDNTPDSPAYLVEIKRGKTFATVLVDAVTGQVLLS